MDRFGIFKNPMTDNNDTVIIQTIKPVSLFTVNASKSKGVSKEYDYNGDKIILSVHYSQETEESVLLKVMDRAFHWYIAVLKAQEEIPDFDKIVTKEWVEERRKAKGLTKRELASRLNIEETLLSQWFGYRNPSGPALAALYYFLK